MNYKGELKTISELEPGMIVELVDFGVFDYVRKDKSTPVLGVVDTLRSDLYKSINKYPVISIWDKDTKSFIKKILYNKEKTLYTNYGVPPDTKAFKLLTGTKASELSKLHKATVRLNTSLSVGAIAFSMGSDPEIFVTNENDEIIPAYAFLPEKSKSKKIYKGNGVYSLFWDGFQAEFTTVSERCLSWVVDSMQYALTALLAKASAFDPKAQLSIKNVLPVNEEVLSTAAEAHVAFGCKPSLNAYNAKGLVIDNPRHIPFRFTGGHIHFGNVQLHTNIVETVKMLDALLGIWAVGAFASIDTPVRRQFYGLAGEYRKPNHGLEYRTLSNAWLCHPAITMCVFDMARYVASAGFSNNRSVFIDESESKIQGIINNCDVTAARKMINNNAHLYKFMAGRRYGTGSKAAEMILSLANNGVESELDYKDLVENWGLKKLWVAHSDGVGKNFGKFLYMKESMKRCLL